MIIIIAIIASTLVHTLSILICLRSIYIVIIFSYCIENCISFSLFIIQA